MQKKNSTSGVKKTGRSSFQSDRHENRFALGLGALAVALFVPAVAYAENWSVYWPNNAGELNRAIDLDSIARVGDRVSYRIRWHSTYGSGRTSYERLVVSCEEHKRGTVPGTSSPGLASLYSVFDGTKAALEFDIACGNVQSPNYPMVSEAAQAGENWSVYWPNGASELNRAIDLGSIVRVGDRVTYRIRWHNTYGGGYTGSERLVASCRDRRRGTLSGEATVESASLYSVFDGTKTAMDFDIACGNVQSPNYPIVSETSVVASDTRAPANSGASGQAPAPGGSRAQAAPAKPEKIRSTGSGFFVASGMVVTNDHVAGNCESLFVSADGKRMKAYLAGTSKETDLAIVAVPGWTAVKLPAIRQSALLGEEVTVAGHPLSGLLSRGLIVTSGQVNALAGLSNDPTRLQISAQVEPGNSGGPVLDKAGNVVGVVVAKLNAELMAKYTGDLAQNINFAIKPEVLRLFLDSNAVSYGSRVSPRLLDGARLAKAAGEFTVLVECN